jgi:hypothetical protein
LVLVCVAACHHSSAHVVDAIADATADATIDAGDPCAACTTDQTCELVGCGSAGPTFACATPVPAGLPAPACAADAADSDGDGLLDAWETAGYIDVNCNGVNDGDGVDVQLPGAHVASPDLYIEIDYLERPSDSCNPGPCTTCAIDDDCAGIPGEQCGSGGVCVHTHRPKQAAIDAVTTALARGVYLHVDASHADAIPEAGKSVVTFMTLNPVCTGTDGTAVRFQDLKQQYFFHGSAAFDAVRRRVYHYAVFAHYSSCPPGPSGDSEQYCSQCPIDRGGNAPKSGATGTGETPGNDFVVSLGSYLFDTGLPLTANLEGGTFMHELGHNLGLGHGVALDASNNPVPAQSPNRSPNYLSVMNYSYQTLGVPSASAPGGGTAATFALQYSDTAACAALDEDHLDETAGAQCGASSQYVVYWAPGDFAGNAIGGFNHHATATTGTGVNWNLDSGNVLDTDVAVDLNNDSAHQVHRAMNDWNALHVNTSCYQWTLAD